MTASIDVLIVTHRAGPLLQDCLAGLAGQRLKPARTMVVVSSSVVPETPDGVEVIHTKQPSDFAPAANRGLSLLGNRPVVLLNDDTVAHPGFLDALASAATTEGIYQPRILLPNGTVDNTGHRLFWDGFNVARDRGQTTVRPASTCGAFSGAAVLFTPGVLERVGLFDEEFGAYGEDLDLSLRAVRLGFAIRHVPSAIITHRLGATYGRTSPRKIFLVERNRTRAAVRSMPMAALAMLPATTAVRIASMGVAALRGTGLGAGAGFSGAVAALAGMAAGTADAPWAWSKRAADKPNWVAGERAMWRHLSRQRVGLNDWFGEPITGQAWPRATDPPVPPAG